MSPRKRSRLPAAWEMERHRYLAHHRCKHGRRRLRNLTEQREQESEAALHRRVRESMERSR